MNSIKISTQKFGCELRFDVFEDGIFTNTIIYNLDVIDVIIISEDVIVNGLEIELHSINAPVIKTSRKP